MLATGPEGGDGGARGDGRPGQRLEGAEADHGAERDRDAVRERRVDAPGRRLRRLARRTSTTPSSRRASSSGRTRAAGTQQSKGSVITLQVSKGPQTIAGPGRDEPVDGGRDRAADAVGLRGPGGRGDRRPEDLDGLVLSQDPEGGTKAEQGTTVVIVVGRFEAPDRDDDDRREPPDPRRRRRRRPLQRARDLARVRPLGARGARPGALRDDDDRDRPRRPLGARRPEQQSAARVRRRRRRCRCSPTRGRPRRSARSTSSCRSCTARSARTARSRACSSSPASPTSAPASPPRRSAWTRTCSRRCCATAASRSRAT